MAIALMMTVLIAHGAVARDVRDVRGREPSASAAGRVPAAVTAARCRQPRRSSLVLRTRRVLAWRISAADRTMRIEACELPSGRPHLVLAYDGSSGADFVSRVIGAGHYLALSDDSLVISPSTSGDIVTLIVFDARRGVQTLGEDVAGSRPCCAPSSLEDYAVSAKGFVAWLTATSKTQTLMVHDDRGTRSIVHGRARIFALTFRGDVLRWTSAGRPRSIELR